MKEIEIRKSKVWQKPNIVFRDVCDFDGNHFAIEMMKYDGTPENAVMIAEKLTQQISYKYGTEWSNIQSRIGATDEHGKPKYTISPNFRHIAEVDTKEARYIWGEI